jgi:hypothetical protein
VKPYLTTFERIFSEISRECWSFQLTPQLTGKAQDAYAPEDAKDYDGVLFYPAPVQH